jgi:molecular chaperone DnaJ
MSKRDYYEVLGLKNGASDKEIKKSYRNLAKEHHPDKGGDANAFKEINEAYEVLKDPDKKANYDKYGHQTNRGGYNDDFVKWGERFRQQFNQQTRPVGQNIRLNIKLSLEEAFNGVNKTFKYNRYDSCNDCKGVGGEDEVTCNVCHGSGIIREVYNTQVGVVQNVYPCNHCGGNGKTYKTQCKTCNGNGVVPINDEVTINIPAGISDGDSMIKYSKGNACKNGDSGNLIIVINVFKHEKFLRVLSDLKYIKEISYPDAILGVKIEIPTIEGTTIKLDVPPYSDNESILRLKGKGMTIVNNTERGDYLIQINILMPKEISPEERQLLEKIKEIQEKLEN